MRFLILFMCSFLSSSAFADALLDLGATYSGDSLASSSSTTANTQYFYNLSALFNLDRRMTWNIGWSFFGISHTNTAASVQTAYSSFDFGPALRWNMDKAGIFSFTLAYGYVAKGNFTSGSTVEEWEGTSLFGQFSIQAPVREEKFYIGLSFNYYAANYSKKIVDNVKSSNDVQKSWIFPMLSLTWRP